MEGSGLFNPGFLGSGFIWWIGQIVDDSTWRDNINPEKYEHITDIPAWGYRYKVKIMGHHDQDETSIKAEDLPWAQVMYPVTSGGGQGGSFQTPAIKQGMFVFGFFLDGQDQQVPVIMGVLGNNTKTKMERKTGSEEGGGKNYTPQSFHAKNADEEPTTQKKVSDATFTPQTGEWKDNTAPAKENVTRESSDGTQIKTSADEKKNAVLREKHALVCADVNRQSDMKNIQTVSETMQKNMENVKKTMSDAAKANALPVVKEAKNIEQEMQRASKEMSKSMKGIMNQVQQNATDEFNLQLQPMLNLAVPSFKNKLLEDKIAGLEGIACAFNGINAGLAGLIAGALANLLNKKKKQSRVTPPVGIGTALGSTRGNGGVLETFLPGPNGNGEWTATEALPADLETPGSEILPPLPQEGYYSPVPLCSTEEIVGEVLGSTINQIMQAYDAAAAPVVATVKQSLGATPSPEAGTEGTGTIDRAVNEDNVLAALSSGDLVGSMSSTMAEQAGVNPSIIGPVTNAFITGDYASGVTALLDLAGVNLPPNAAAIANAMVAFQTGDVVGGFNAVSGVLGLDSTLTQGIGGAFAAIKSGDTAALLGAAGGLAAMYPSILNSIIGKGAGLSSASISNLIGGLGASSGMNFDIAKSMSFVQSVTQIFPCDPKPNCSPNDVHTMQDGGHSADGPSNAGVAEKAGNIFTSPKSQLTPAMKSFKTPDLGISSPNLGDIDLADDEGPALEIF